MEEQVKARLIGATVLVVLAVLLVPELLSGPRQSAPPAGATEGKRGTRTVTIDLGGAVDAGARVQQVPTPVDTRPREPVPLPTVQVPGDAAEHGSPHDLSAEAAGPPEDALRASSTPAPKIAASTTSSPSGAPSGSSPTVASTAVTPKPKPAASTTARPAVEQPRAAATGTGGWSVQVGAFGSADTARKMVGDLKRDGLTAYVAPLQRSGKTLHRVRVGPTPTRADADRLAARLKGKGLPASVVPAD